MNTITPFLWFNNNLEQAVNYYQSVFTDFRLIDSHGNTKARPGSGGAMMSATFEMHGQRFSALNGGPHFQFTPAVSFFISCETQDEVDNYWDALCKGGEPGRCGWLRDPFGLSWQVVPKSLGKLMNSGDAIKSSRVMQAMLKMDKLSISELQAAFDGDASS
jgi:predicted 3-demethylubiquinone-9 3-methyltransferase (glyoxalase superfamily)